METFESFDALFQKAIYLDIIKTAEGDQKDALNSINQTFYEWKFSIWLKNCKGFNPEKTSIQPFLTKENWIEFYREHKKEAESTHAEYLKEQADWKRKIDAEEPLSEQQVPQMSLVPPAEISKKKFMAKYHFLAYLFDCFAAGKIPKFGQKDELQKEGIKRIGKGKGNRFYKLFGEIDKLDPDYNSKLDLIKIWGENWRNAVLDLSDDADLLDNYLKSKDL
jgi:hypothetical protein